MLNLRKTKKYKTLVNEATKRSISLDNVNDALILWLDDNARRDETIQALRNLGFTLKGIGDFFGLTRQAIGLVTGSGQIAAPMMQVDIASVAKAIWLEAIEEMDWWGSNGRMNNGKLVDRLRKEGLSFRQAREYAKHISQSKTDVILFSQKIPMKFDLREGFYLSGPEKMAWFDKHTQAGLTRHEVWVALNSFQNLKVPEQTFNNFWRGRMRRKAHTGYVPDWAVKPIQAA